jgi:hypothetical protein
MHINPKVSSLLFPIKVGSLHWLSSFGNSLAKWVYALAFPPLKHLDVL